MQCHFNKAFFTNRVEFAKAATVQIVGKFTLGANSRLDGHGFYSMVFIQWLDCGLVVDYVLHDSSKG